MLNVALNKNKLITQVFAGELYEAHDVGCAYVKAAKTCVISLFLFNATLSIKSGLHMALISRVIFCNGLSSIFPQVDRMSPIMRALWNVIIVSMPAIPGIMPLGHVGCAYVKEHAMFRCDDRFDVVIASNSGYPLDQNLYQTVKGMSAAHKIVKEGGTIIMVSECADGLPDHGKFADIFKRAKSPQALLIVLVVI